MKIDSVHSCEITNLYNSNFNCILPNSNGGIANMVIMNSNCSISNYVTTNNTVVTGGALFCSRSSITVKDSSFT